MTKDEEKLLTEVLFEQLPYGILVEDDRKQGVVIVFDQDYHPDIEHIKPFLRPLISMTDEEKKEMHELLSPEGTASYKTDGISIPVCHAGNFVSYEYMHRVIRYLNKKHFDIRDLIPKGLAKVASYEMYETSPNNI